jgi:hypothetical protein
MIAFLAWLGKFNPPLFINLKLIKKKREGKKSQKKNTLKQRNGLE